GPAPAHRRQGVQGPEALQGHQARQAAEERPAGASQTCTDRCGVDRTRLARARPWRTDGRVHGDRALAAEGCGGERRSCRRRGSRDVRRQPPEGSVGPLRV
ncbi:MAG: hypothetical protein AVDCRST_MAG76-1189, partial [uncultured Acidimicrobiales bacterium]